MDTKQFWSWFSENEELIYEFENDIEAVFQMIGQQLVQLDENVTFEISTPADVGKRQFVLTAGGLVASFPAVEELVDTAPDLPRWHFVKFRQRSAKLLNVEFEELKINPSDVHYVVVKDQSPNKAGVLLFFEHYSDSQRDMFGNVAYLFLDQALGEYTVEMRVGIVELFDRSSKYFLSARPISELSEHYDSVVATLQPLS